MTTFTASKVRELAVTMGAMNLPTTRDMLYAYADRLEADEKSHPIYQLMATDDSWWDVSRELYEAEGSHAGRTRILYTHHAPADAERLVQALRLCMDAMLEKGVPTHPDADARVAYTAAEEALAAHAAQAQPPAASVPDGFLRHVAAVCRGAVENCRPKASLIPEDPQEHNGGLCLNELTHIAGEIDRMLAAQENPNG